MSQETPKKKIKLSTNPIIDELEQSFVRLNDKLVTKLNFISNKSAEYEHKIRNDEFHIDGLNSYRQKLLDRLNKQMRYTIDKANGIIEADSIKLDKNAKDRLTCLSKTFKLIKFERQDKELMLDIFNHLKFLPTLDLLMLNKYSKLIVLKNRNFSIKHDKQSFFEVLTPNKILIEMHRNSMTKSATLFNNKGEVLNTNGFRVSEGIYRHTSQCIYRIFSDLVIKRSLYHAYRHYYPVIDVFDINFNYKKRIHVNDDFSLHGFVMSGEDFAFQRYNKNFFELIFYNFSRSEFERIKFQKRNKRSFYDSGFGNKCRLIHFNSQKLYIDDNSGNILIFDRTTGAKLNEYMVTASSHIFDGLSKIYHCSTIDSNSRNRSIEIRDLNGEFLGAIPNFKFDQLEFDACGSLILNKRQNDSSVQYDEL